MKRSMMVSTLMLAVASVATACATGTPIQTASGRPDVTMHNVDVACVKAGFLNGLLNDGYTVRESTDTRIVVGRPSRNTMANVLLSTGYSGSPEERVIVTMVTNGNDLRVVFEGAYVSNQGTAFEKVQPIGATQADQEKVEAMRARAERSCAKK